MHATFPREIRKTVRTLHSVHFDQDDGFFHFRPFLLLLPFGVPPEPLLTTLAARLLALELVLVPFLSESSCLFCTYALVLLIIKLSWRANTYLCTLGLLRGLLVNAHFVLVITATLHALLVTIGSGTINALHLPLDCRQ